MCFLRENGFVFKLIEKLKPQQKDSFRQLDCRFCSTFSIWSKTKRPNVKIRVRMKNKEVDIFDF